MTIKKWWKNEFIRAQTHNNKSDGQWENELEEEAYGLVRGEVGCI